MHSFVPNQNAQESEVIYVAIVIKSFKYDWTEQPKLSKYFLKIISGKGLTRGSPVEISWGFPGDPFEYNTITQNSSVTESDTTMPFYYYPRLPDVFECVEDLGITMEIRSMAIARNYLLLDYAHVWQGQGEFIRERKNKSLAPPAWTLTWRRCPCGSRWQLSEFIWIRQLKSLTPSAWPLGWRQCPWGSWWRC